MNNFNKKNFTFIKYFLFSLILTSFEFLLTGCETTVNAPYNSDSSESATHITTTETFTTETTTESYTDTESYNTEPHQEELLGVTDLNTHFHHDKITKAIKSRIIGKSYPDNALISLSNLRYVQVLCYGFDGETHVGELIVNKAVADDITDIFKELYDAQYPIEKMVLIDEYNADDELSMRDNNSSAFNYRTIAGTSKLSNHAMGIAIDINPLYNPYITTIKGVKTILPENASDYADRSKDFPAKIEKGDICYNAFIKRGWTWGGEWISSKDYQHFEKVIKN